MVEVKHDEKQLAPASTEQLELDLKVESDGEGSEGGLQEAESGTNLDMHDSFNRRFVQALTLAIQDIGSSEDHKDEFTELLGSQFRHIIRLKNSVTGGRGAVADLCGIYATELVEKANLIGESIAREQQQDETDPEALDRMILEAQSSMTGSILSVLAVELEQYFDEAKASSQTTYHAGMALIQFVTSISKQSKTALRSNSRLNLQLCKVGQSLLDRGKPQVIQNLGSALFDFFCAQEDFSQADLKTQLMDSEDNLFSFFVLGKMLARAGDDKEVHAYLVSKANDLVFSDTESLSTSSASFFTPFFATLSEESLITDIAEQAQTMVKLAKGKISSVVHLVKSLTFRLSVQGAQKLLTELIPEDLLREHDKSVKDLFAVVCSKIDGDCTAEFETEIIKNFILSAFANSVSDLKLECQGKLEVVGHAFTCIYALHSNRHSVSDAVVSEASKQLLDLLFSERYKETEVLIPESIHKVFKSDILANNKSIGQQLSAQSQKIQTACLANLVADLQSQLDQSVKDSISDNIQKTLGKQNFNSVTNSSLLLALIGLLNSFGRFDQVVSSQASVQKWLTSSGFANSEQYFLKNPSQRDTTNHLGLIRQLLFNPQFNLNKTQEGVLMNTLLEYVTNEEYNFRPDAVYRAVQEVVERCTSEQAIQTLEAILDKQNQILGRPIVVVKDPEAEIKMPNVALSLRIRNTCLIIVEGLVKQKKELGYDLFTLTLQALLFEVTCTSVKDLRAIFARLSTLFGPENLYSLFNAHKDQLIDQFLKRRTGILSPDLRVRKLAHNILICLCWSGALEEVLVSMEPIFNYKPVQMLDKMESLLKSEFDKIPHYDLLFYSEMSKDLLKIFDQKNTECLEKALRIPNQATEALEEAKEESKAEPAPQVQADLEPSGPVDLASLMKKKAKKAKEAKKAKKAKKAPSKGDSTTKPAASKQAEEKKIDAPVESKEERNKNDRAQMLKYVNQVRESKAAHIATCQSILRHSNNCQLASRLNYQDKTLNHTINSFVKLLNLNSTRFSTQFFLQNLFDENKESPFFGIKKSILTCFLAIAHNKLSPRTTQEFQNCLIYLDTNADFSEMEGGYIQLSLTIANFVLKDPSVNLSVKEVGLAVTQSIMASNSSVESIDIVRLTINMLKTNYIANNLGQYIRKLMQRCSKIEIAMLLQRLFEYQPVPRKTLLLEVLNYDEPLFCPVWFQTQLWVLLFDDELGSLARKIWNKYGFYLQSETIQLAKEKSHRNLFNYLRDKNYSIFNCTIKAAASAIELLHHSPKVSIISDLIEFYDDEWKVIEHLSLESTKHDVDKDQKVQMSLIADDRQNRIAVPQILHRVAKLLKTEDLEPVLVFLVTKSCLDQSEEVCEAGSQAAIAIIKAQSEKHSSEILKILENFIDAQSGLAAQDGSKDVAVKLLASLAPHLKGMASKKSDTKLIATFDKLITLAYASQSDMVRRSVCRCIPQLSRYFPEKSKQYLQTQLKALKESQESLELKGIAYVVAGLLKGQGMKVLNEMDLIPSLGKEYFTGKRADPVRKQACLHLFETLSFSMGRSFELYLDTVFPYILASVSDQKEPVRLAASSALQTIMKNFSNYAITQVLPQFLKQLEDDNWRSKISTVEALGNMAYCAPKQISSFLPQIVKGLRDVMNDTHEKVHEAAIQSISKIGSVIKCPEVGDMLEVIIKALADTSTHLNDALNLLLETSFVHAIDAPSLSLLVPLLDSGLMKHDNNSKQMAAQLMGNICSLTKNPADLLPYMTILMPAIKNSLFDSIPEIRASAAKAMGSLSKGLGIEHSAEMLGWLREHLNKKGIPTSEKLGAAQGFAELISAHGVPYYEVNVEEVIIKAKDDDEEIRESYRSVIVFLPDAYTKFVDYLPRMVPIMIEGLSDEADQVRKISMRSVKICIKRYGKEAPNQLVMPVLRMMFNIDSRVRQSSSILMFQLVKELENDVIKAQPKYIDMDTKHKILSSMFILKYDLIERVSTQAGQIWKNIVDNQLIILKQVIDTLIEIVFNIIQNPSYELQEMGLACMRGMVEKFGEKLVSRALDIFERLLDMATESNQTVGICKVLFNMTQASTFRLLTVISPRMISILEDNLSSEIPEIREWSAKVFITMFSRQSDKNFIEPTLNKVIFFKLKKYVRENKQDEADRLIVSLKMMISSTGDLRLEDRLLKLCEITKKDEPFSVAQSQVLRAIAPFIAPKVFHKAFYQTVLVALNDELQVPEIDDKDRIKHVLMAYTELITSIPEVDAKLVEEEINKFYGHCRSQNRPDFYLDMIAHFFPHSKINVESQIEIYLEHVLCYMGHPDKEMIEKVIAALAAIFKRISKETQFAVVPLIREQIEKQCIQLVGGGSPLLGLPLEFMYKKKVEFLEILKNDKGVKVLVEVIQAALMHGNVAVRTDAAFCFKFILDFAPAANIKKEVIKICGAMIRVVNDKFPQELKLQIFHSLRLIQIKGAQAAKGMQAQLQTTFLKAIGDPLSGHHTRRIVIENLILLIKGVPRVDAIIKELNSLIEGSKVDGEQKIEVSECLALIIRAKGKAIQSAMSQTVYKTMTEILSDQAKSATNDKILCNCACALSFLAAYSSDPSQMQALFTAYDDMDINPITLPLKFGILINGNDTIDKSELAKQFETLLVEKIVDQGGFEEIDDDPAPVVGGDDEVFRFKGVVDLVAFMVDKFCRRDWCQAPDSVYMRLLFSCFNKAGTLDKLRAEKKISADSYRLLNQFLSAAPVKAVKGQFTPELAQVLTEGLACIQAFYLDHGGLNQNTTDALLNVLQLNYDNYIELDSPQLLKKELVEEALAKPALQDIFSEDMKLYAVDIIFKQA